jgi:hypothetical protein
MPMSASASAAWNEQFAICDASAGANSAKEHFWLIPSLNRNLTEDFNGKSSMEAAGPPIGKKGL